MILSSLVLLAAQGSTLWQIGAPDGTPSGFGLAPGGYARYGADPIVVVGASSPRDWPYVLPGPDDAWAGGRAHRSEIAFGLAGVSKGAKFRLTVDLADTHPATPPHLRLVVNGKPLAEWQAPRGGGDDVILGRTETGKPARWTLDLPAAALQNGNNVLGLVNDRGSWAVFDAVRLEGEGGVRSAPVRDEIRLSLASTRQAILRTPSGPRQPVDCEILNLGPARTASLRGEGAVREIALRPGRQTVELRVAPAKRPRDLDVEIASGTLRAKARGRIAPVRPWTIYLLPHSHVDVGYTDVQDEVLRMHERNFADAIEVARESRANPDDSRFRFNVEATWVLDRLLQTGTDAQKAAAVAALRDRTIFLSAGYANLLTGVMHPEETMQSFRYSRILGERLGLDLDTATQTDVPGVSWGEVVALHEAGVENLLLMPNAGDRVGGVHRAWRDRPFWWIGPSGRERVLVWQIDPYSIGHGPGWTGDRSKPLRSKDPMGRFVGDVLFPKLARLAAEKYPYDVLAEPWSPQDNAPVDADVPVAARMWNERYVYPRVVLATAQEAFRELRRRYGARLPVQRGDYTPYWEDGVGSSAAETALNREMPDRLVQAETLFAMGGFPYPAEDFLEAWRNAILYSEHTWGAWNSVSSPDDPGVAAQWRIKGGFARTADAMSRALRARALGPSSGRLEVRNASSWPRTDLVRLAPAQSRAGDRVEDEAGRPLPSQRLRTGELAVLVRDVPPLGARRLRVVPGAAHVEGRAVAEGNVLRDADYELTLDASTGAIASFRARALGKELAQRPLNAYLYLPGTDLKGLRPNGTPRFEVVEPGPLVATLRATSSAPGARGLTQDVTLVAGLGRVEATNVLDKLPIRAKEGVHFAFPFAVPQGRLRVDLPWALVQPERDQIAGANKNWLTVQGYADVSNAAYGVTWAALDAPLIEVGEVSANLLGSGWNPDEWRRRIDPTQTLYSWALNNHWHTNYRAEQSGPLTFRYAMQAHGPFAPDAATRFGAAVRQPLVVAPAVGSPESLFTIDDPTVVATRVVPSDDGRAIVVRLYGTTARTRRVRLRLRADLGAVYRSDLTQKPRTRLGDVVEVPGLGVVTLRIERTSAALP